MAFAQSAVAVFLRKDWSLILAHQCAWTAPQAKT